MDARGASLLARDAYIEVLKRDPAHLEALTGLAGLLFATGYRSAARLTYEEALRHHGDTVPLLVNLANTLLELGDARAARTYYERGLALDALCAPAHQGLSYALERIGEFALAQEHRAIGFAAQPSVCVPYRGEGTASSVLVLLCARGGNVAADLILDDSRCTLIKLFPEFYDAGQTLPPHDVAFNAIGDAEMCEASLVAARSLLRASLVRVVNAPERVLATSRVRVSERCADLANVVAPSTRLVARDRLHEERTFPLLLRSPGFHTGEHFERIARASDMAEVASRLPGEALLAIEWLDASGPDGYTRKYRVMAIDGELYPLHLAISTGWKVHYFTADAMEQERHREEEARFLNAMPDAIGASAVRALYAVAQTLQLDYAGIDFGIDAQGRVLLFEANATMKIVPPNPGDPRQTYRRDAAERALSAARNLILRRPAFERSWRSAPLDCSGMLTADCSGEIACRV